MVELDALATMLTEIGLGGEGIDFLTPGAVGTVARVRRTSPAGDLVVKTYPPTLADRAAAEVAALQALAAAPAFPAPAVLAHGRHDGIPYLLMPLLPGTRVDATPPARQGPVFVELGRLLRRLHEVEPPAALPVVTPAAAIAEYAARHGPEAELLATRVADLSCDGTAFSHGDLSDANVLVADDGRITGIVDWERAARGDPLHDLARATFHAARKDPAAADALVHGYGLDASHRHRLALHELIHGAELWNWFTETDDDAGAEAVGGELRTRLSETGTRCAAGPGDEFLRRHQSYGSSNGETERSGGDGSD